MELLRSEALRASGVHGAARALIRDLRIPLPGQICTAHASGSSADLTAAVRSAGGHIRCGGGDGCEDHRNGDVPFLVA